MERRTVPGWAARGNIHEAARGTGIELAIGVAIGVAMGVEMGDAGGEPTQHTRGSSVEATAESRGHPKLEVIEAR